MTRAFLPAMRARRERADRQRRVDLRHGRGRRSFPRTAPPNTASIGLTRALAEELRDDGIAVNAVCPGSVDTEMLRVGMPGAKPDMSPEDVAGVVLYLAAGGAGRADRVVRRRLRVRMVRDRIVTDDRHRHRGERTGATGAARGCRCFRCRTWCCSRTRCCRLHIFEERYRALARDILGGRALSGGQLDRAEARATTTSGPPVAPIAGVGEVVMAHELPDGRFNLVVRGRARVRIDEELTTDRPYRVVSASVLPDIPPPDRGEMRDADQSLRALIGQLADAIPEGGELLRQVVAGAGDARRAGGRRRGGADRRRRRCGSGCSRPATSASGSSASPRRSSR